ncbi:hypothetical protein [Gorillibacterium sp. CAU 1737]|uniref:hypothetical protein n=1 Tax=Gorillibacterium sp. CAU 1737 TaxID=3140362 RepID=UPI00326178F5
MTICLFLLTTFCLFIGLIMVFSNKIQKKLDMFIIIMALYLSYNSILSVVLDIVHLPFNGISASLLNILLSFILFLVIKKERIDIKKIRLNVSIVDVYAVCLSLAAPVVLFLTMYSGDFNIKFLTTDPSVHYLFADYFSKTGELLLTHNDLAPYAHMSSYPFLTYVNMGLLMSMVHSGAAKVGIYLVGNLIVYFLIILSVYTLFRYYSKNTSFLPATIVVAATAIGYNMNSVIFGFSSQMTGIFLILVLILLVESIEEGPLKIIASTVVMIGIFYAYYYFIPATVMAFVGLSIIQNKQKISFIKKLFSPGIIWVVLSAGIFGSLYLFVLNHTVKSGDVDSIAYEGFIYRDFYSVFLPYLLFAFVAIWMMWKQKMGKGIIIYSGMYLLFTVCILILGMNQKASSYYFFKNYYLLENLIIVLFGVGLAYVKSHFKPVYLSYLGLLAFLFVNSAFVDKYIQDKNNLFNPEIQTNITKIHKFNFQMQQKGNMNITYTKDQRGFMDYVVSNRSIFIGDKGYIPVVGDLLQQLWFYSYTQIWPKYGNNRLAAMYEANLFDYDGWQQNADKNPYLIIMENPDTQKWIKDAGFDSSIFDVVYQVKGASLLKLKGAR